MVLPIYIYGEPILREETIDVKGDSAELQELIDNMLETLSSATGIGLAAPQVGRKERLFVVDLSLMADQAEKEGEHLPPQPMVMINPEIIWESTDEIEYEEGCLSIPDLRDVVLRPEQVQIQYLDRNFTTQEIEVTGLLARVIQHEYDHLDGILFIDRLSPFRRRLLRRRLKEMAEGSVTAEYPVFAAGKLIS